MAVRLATEAHTLIGSRTSILIDWSPRYDMNPADEWETPDYIVHEPKELLTLIESLEAELHKDGNE